MHRYQNIMQVIFFPYKGALYSISCIKRVLLESPKFYEMPQIVVDGLRNLTDALRNKKMHLRGWAMNVHHCKPVWIRACFGYIMASFCWPLTSFGFDLALFRTINVDQRGGKTESKQFQRLLLAMTIWTGHVDQRWSTPMVLNKAQVEPKAGKGSTKRSPYHAKVSRPFCEAREYCPFVMGERDPRMDAVDWPGGPCCYTTCIALVSCEGSPVAQGIHWTLSGDCFVRANTISDSWIWTSTKMG